MDQRRQSSRWFEREWRIAGGADHVRRLALQNYLRDGLFLRVRERQRSILYSQLRREFSRLAMESHGGTAPGHARDFAVAPAHAMIPSGAECFHRGFLCCESRSITLKAVRLRVAIANLPGSKNALYETVAKALDGLADAGNLGDIDACAYDHDERRP